MTPAGTFNELDVQNEWEENTNTLCESYINSCLKQLSLVFFRSTCVMLRVITRFPLNAGQKCPKFLLFHGGILFVSVVVVVDSHIQRIVLATEETTVTQQVSHRPIKRQSRLWSQRGTKVNGSHHGDNPLLRPTGIQIATKSYAALQAMAPTNIKTVHQTSLLHSRATSIDSECCRLPTTSVLSKKPEKLRSNQF